MHKTPLHLTKNYLLGLVGEEAVAKAMRELGFFTIKKSDYFGAEKNMAPHIRSIQSQLAVLDLDISKGGKRKWVEVKTKSKENHFSKRRGIFVHGINLAHWNIYREVERITGSEAWLAIYEVSHNVTLMQRLSELAKKTWHGMPDVNYCPPTADQDGGMMIYFARSSFLHLDELPEDFS